jgi:hypothetical protein
VEKLQPSLTVIDGIYGLERGPFYGGKAVPMNALAASQDPLAADAAGAALAGFEPSRIPYIKAYGDRHTRSPLLDEFDFRGTPVDDLTRPLKWDNPWRDDNTGPKVWDRIGIEGVYFPKYDKTLCTGCAGLYSHILYMIMTSYQGYPFDEIEILTGKDMTPSGKAKRSILFGNCMIKANRNHPDSGETHLVKGCPPTMASLLRTLDECGIHPNMESHEKFRSSLLNRYKGKAGYDEGFYYLRERDL